MADDRKRRKVELADGVVKALTRLKNGDTLERERNRSKITWLSDGTYLHHLTFWKLKQVRAVKRVKGKPGFKTFAISAKGQRLAR